jgi:hypothetical protein
VSQLGPAVSLEVIDFHALTLAPALNPPQFSGFRRF